MSFKTNNVLLALIFLITIYSLNLENILTLVPSSRYDTKPVVKPVQVFTIITILAYLKTYISKMVNVQAGF